LLTIYFSKKLIAMNTTPFIPEPLFVIDNTSIANEGPRKGRLIGTFDIMNRPTPEDGLKWIGDTKPYGDGFPDLEEAKAYAKLFAASPDLLESLRLALPYIEGAYECAFPDSDHNEYVLEAAKAAIAKATGN
jgi:hypothetical protein